MTSILTGFPNLDSLIGGLQPADLLLLASPSMKSVSLALSVVLNVAVSAHQRVGMFTPEMNKHHVVQRLLSLSTGIDLHDVRTGSMMVDDHNRFTRNVKLLSRAKIWIDDRADLSVLQLQQRAQAMVKAHDITFLFIDNIHLLRLGNASDQYLHQIPGMLEPNTPLKMLAKVLNIPLLVLAPHAPLTMNKRRTITPYEQQAECVYKKDADHVLFLYRRNISHPIIQDTSTFITPLHIVNHHNGFVTDIALPSPSAHTPSPQEAYVLPSTSHDNAAS